MEVEVYFYSYFKDLTGVSKIKVPLAEGGTINDLLTALYQQFPKLSAMHNSTLIAVGLDYVGKSHKLLVGEEVSLFPPVQGG